MKIKLGVIFGGCTVEHEVSIITAVQAMNNIDEEKYDIIPIYISKDRIWYTGKMLMDIDVYRNFDTLKKYAKKVMLVKKENGFFLQKVNGIFKSDVAELDVVFPIVHGKGVEDGSLAGLLDSVGIPYVGPNVLGAALGQDKVVQKQVMSSCNINIPKYTWFYDTDYLNDNKDILANIKALKYPVIVKPANLGSSIGISVAKNETEVDNCIMEAIKYDNKIVVEEMIPNLMEVNCSVLGNYEYQETSAIDEMLTSHDFLTYNDKYLSGGKGKTKACKTAGAGKMSSSDRVIPARISSEVEATVRDMAKATFRALNLSGIARIDFLINKKTNEVYVNEPNTIPGSLAFYLWSYTGKEYKDLLDDAITLCIKSYKNNAKKVSSFESNILSNFSGSKGLKGIKGSKGKLM